MATIRPFRGYLPRAEVAAEVAALPYDVMNEAEAREMVIGKPHSFLHVDRAEIDLPEGGDPYAPEVYAKAAANLQNMIDTGIYEQSPAPCYYLYRQTFRGRTQTGLVVCASVDDYKANIIKKHELTRPDKEQDRINHVDACSAHTGLIFLAYRHQEEIRTLLNDWMQRPPVFSFNSDGVVDQAAWVIDDPAVIDRLTKLFAAVPAFYIADGHHRTASAVRVAEMRRAAHPDYTGEEEFNSFLAVLLPEDELKILEYNRVVKDLNGLSGEEFLRQVQERFALEKIADAPEPARHQFGMFWQGQWYLLTAKPEIINENDPIERLDTALLQKHLLAPVLGIDDPRTNSRIGFVGGIRGVKELEKRVNSDMELAFLLHPVSMDELMQLADAGQIMPPKSTWFEPKLYSGIFVHTFEK